MLIMILIVSAIAFILVMIASAPVDQRLVLKVRYSTVMAVIKSMCYK
jgi:hypothetical protein